MAVGLTWLILAVVLCTYAWFGARCVWALPVAVIAVAGALWVPTGTPRFTALPPGQHTILGAKIEEGRAIYVLIDGDVPAYYVLPYSQSAADRLQGALDAAEAGQGNATITIDGEGGGEVYDGPPPVTGTASKPAEVPAYSF
ncbi:hypothetical protein ATER59S_01877 [Aquamicrobium terrae]